MQIGTYLTYIKMDLAFCLKIGLNGVIDYLIRWRRAAPSLPNGPKRALHKLI